MVGRCTQERLRCGPSPKHPAGLQVQWRVIEFGGFLCMPAALFTKPVVMVTFAPQDEITGGWAVLERPSVVTHNGASFIVGYHSAEASARVRGRRVLIPLQAITSLTEYDTVRQVWDQRPRRTKLRR